MELFVYVKMGGDHERVSVLPLTNEATVMSLAYFDAGRAQCSIQDDRHRLLAVIEAGTLRPQLRTNRTCG
jgi:hypothetical protein